MERKFSFIELIIVIAIIATLAGMLFPVLRKAREKQRMNTTYKEYYMGNRKEVKMSEQTWKFLFKNDLIECSDISDPHLIKVNIEFIKSKLSDSSFSQTTTIIQDLESAGYFGTESDLAKQSHGPKEEIQSMSMYDNWVEFTGNPKKFTKQQFEVLYDQDMLDEFKWSVYQTATGNPQNLTYEEFEAFKKSKQIRLYRKEKKVVKSQAEENW